MNFKERKLARTERYFKYEYKKKLRPCTAGFGPECAKNLSKQIIRDLKINKILK